MIPNRIDDQQGPFLTYSVYDAFEWTETEMAGFATSLAHSSYVTTNSVV
jgi:hypothetical protein